MIPLFQLNNMANAAFNGSTVQCTQTDHDNFGTQYKHEPGPLKASATSVFINGKPAGVVGDQSICAKALNTTAKVKENSSTVFIENKQAARVDDATDHIGGKITEGSDNVFIG